MSLDVYLDEPNQDSTTLWTRNITHNVDSMAIAAGIYECIWRPETVGIVIAAQLVYPLQQGLMKLRTEREKIQPLEPSNGWGSYEGFVDFVRAYLSAACENPLALVKVWR